MFETLRKQGSYRIDYLNHAARGSPGAFAFYVRGELAQDAPYSVSAKHHLYAGLDVIQKLLNNNHLVAIYVDINPAHNLYRPAYVQMKRDLRAGYFRRVFTFNSADLLDDRAAVKDLQDLHRELAGFDVLHFQEGNLHAIPLLTLD
ncbi:MAG: hypothetical protein ROW52_07950 [Anaerolineaceae bacterium]|jgi:hypothetical protein